MRVKGAHSGSMTDRIADLLWVSNESYTVADLAERLGADKDHVRRTLYRMRERDLVRRRLVIHQSLNKAVGVKGNGMRRTYHQRSEWRAA